MTSQQEVAVKAIYKDLMTVAADEGQRERERLGRELTEAETNRVVDMVLRQLETALAMARF